MPENPIGSGLGLGVSGFRGFGVLGVSCLPNPNPQKEIEANRTAHPIHEGVVPITKPLNESYKPYHAKKNPQARLVVGVRCPTQSRGQPPRKDTKSACFGLWHFQEFE